MLPRPPYNQIHGCASECSCPPQGRWSEQTRFGCQAQLESESVALAPTRASHACLHMCVRLAANDCATRCRPRRLPALEYRFAHLRWCIDDHLNRKPLSTDGDRPNCCSFTGKLLQSQISIRDGESDSGNQTGYAVDCELGNRFSQPFFEILKDRRSRVCRCI